ncbi:hypothetical protein NCU03541 [Neurospora crassa OR74A]|uniref:Uncharacterized protein n=1 Tax=Neurospora crassa (strain ATCC 24698 / 74-OR23-1A / CBS 708.71 / DSM 1257 / FGSC 987) TaxID=367110 RepID=F5HBB3_NEUCR|nr:hypothetical protein NCU03541 [Neurospora crassa OR74A]EAA27584.3 hypothetical protein NCU03541 [Neurospora crassa OR74A]|eukprot:XP_956820.3 hypothetical protein NCU03541 [Neurospora crassa OR74A]
MKVFHVEDEEEQQPKEVVMKSVEQVDKDGHVIHHMDDRGNYLDKEGKILPLFHPVTRQPVTVQSEPVQQKQYIHHYNAKSKAVTTIKADITVERNNSARPAPPSERNSVDQDADKGTMNHEDGDNVNHKDEAPVIEQDTVVNQDTIVDADIITDTSTHRTPFGKRASRGPLWIVQTLSSSKYGLLSINENDLYFVFHHVRFPCKQGKYRVVFQVVVNEYRDDQDNRFPPVHMWPQGEYPGEEIARSYQNYKAGALEVAHNVEVICCPQWTRWLTADYWSPIRYEYFKALCSTAVPYTPERWSKERERLASLRRCCHVQMLQAQIEAQGPVDNVQNPILVQNQLEEEMRALDAHVQAQARKAFLNKHLPRI